jgi:ubiquinone biosynthesis protein
MDAVAGYGHVAADLVRLAIVAVLETTFVDGIFHGDLHPGNVMVTDHGLALLDFGIVGRLSEEQRRNLLALLIAAFGNDRLGIVRALHGFGALPPDVDPEEFVTKLPPQLSREERRAVRADRDAIGERISSLVRTLASNGFKVNPELSLFAKNLVYLGDAVQRHAPDFEMIDEVTAMVMRLGDRLGP